MKIFLFFLSFIFIFSTLFSQTRKDLESKRKSCLNDIKYTNKLININETNRKSSYNKLLLINSKITIRKNLILSISDEINYLNSSIEINKEIIIRLELDLNNIKKDYAKIIYYSFKNQSEYDKLMFILASENINIAFKRLKYLQQYSKYRTKQAYRIVETRDEIRNKISELANLSNQRSALLVQEKSQNHNLIVEKKQENIEFDKYKSNDKDLKLKLRKHNNFANKLQKEIARIIEDEARKAAQRFKNSSGDFFQLTPEEKLISDNFAKNKNRLPWPTKRGVITGYFGEQPHPFLKGIKVKNDGVDISTTEGSIVRAIYQGIVTKVLALSGTHKTVIIRHGNYLSVYSNLKNVIVNQGDKVSTKQTIGVVFTENDKDHKTVLQFQIWRDIDTLNPTDWLANGDR